MRSIVVYGHDRTAISVFNRLTEMLRARGELGVALMYTVQIDPDLAQALREDGIELWYCAPVAAAAGTEQHAHRHLVASSWEALTESLMTAVDDYLRGQAVTA